MTISLPLKTPSERFVGWIPNLTGKLSFSQLGSGTVKGIKVSGRATTPDGNSRIYYVAQERRTGDANFIFDRLSDSISSLLWCESTRMNFVFVGVSNKMNDFDTLVGTAYVFNKEYPVVFDKISNYLESRSALEMLNQVNSDFPDIVKNFGSESLVAAANIEVFRDGKCYVQVERDFPLDSPKSVAFQVYAFLKDVLHTHQHHHEGSDTLIDVHVEDEILHEWRKETLYSLVRFIIASKKTKKLPDLFRASGVLAYTESFYRQHCRELFGGETEAELLAYLGTYNFDNIKDSLNAGILEVEFNNSFKISASIETGVLYFLAIFGSLIAFFQFVPESYYYPSVSYSGSWLYERAASKLYDSPFLMAWLSFLASAVLTLLLKSRKFKNNSNLLNAYRIAFSLPYILHLTLLIVLAAGSFFGLGVITYYLF